MQNLYYRGGRERALQLVKLKCSLFYTDLTEQEIEKNQYRIKLISF